MVVRDTSFITETIHNIYAGDYITVSGPTETKVVKIEDLAALIGQGKYIVTYTINVIRDGDEYLQVVPCHAPVPVSITGLMLAAKNGTIKVEMDGEILDWRDFV